MVTRVSDYHKTYSSKSQKSRCYLDYHGYIDYRFKNNKQYRRTIEMLLLLHVKIQKYREFYQVSFKDCIIEKKTINKRDTDVWYCFTMTIVTKLSIARAK